MKLSIKKITIFALFIGLCIGNTFGGSDHDNQENQQEALDRFLLAAGIIQNQEQESNTQQSTQITPITQNRTIPLPRRIQEKNAFLQAALFDHDLEYIKRYIESIDLKTLLFIVETYEKQGMVDFAFDDIYQYIIRYLEVDNASMYILPTNNDQYELEEFDKNLGVNQISTHIQCNENQVSCCLPLMQASINAAESAEQDSINPSAITESSALISNQPEVIAENVANKKSVSVAKAKKSKSWTCTQCKKKFSSKGNLKRHIDEIHKKIKHPCPDCKKEFSTKESLKGHIEEIHQKIKYQCPDCKKKFSQKGNLNTHIKEIHKKIKYPCPHCKKKCSSKGNLKQHIKEIHKKIKYPCPHCKKKFSQKGNLNTHIKKKHKDLHTNNNQNQIQPHVSSSINVNLSVQQEGTSSMNNTLPATDLSIEQQQNNRQTSTSHICQTQNQLPLIINLGNNEESEEESQSDLEDDNI